MLRSRKRGCCLLAQAFTTFLPSLCPDLCKNRFGASACPTHCIWSSRAWPKAKKSCSGRQTQYLHSRGWCVALNLPYFRSRMGNSFRRQRWPSSLSGTPTSKWPSSKSSAGHPRNAQGSIHLQRHHRGKLLSNIGDNKGGRGIFLCLIVLLAVFSSSYCYVWDNMGNKVWMSGHLQEQLCCTDVCAPQGCDSRNQALSNIGSAWFLSTTDILWIFFLQNKRERQHTTGTTVTQ